MKKPREYAIARQVYRTIALHAMAAILMVASACSSNSRSRLEVGKNSESGASSTKNSAAVNHSDPDPGIVLNCVYDHIQNPPESFSYSYAKDSSTDEHLVEEADITPQSIDGRYRNVGNDHATAFQATRADSSAWSTALVHLTAISGMSSTIAIVNHNSAMKRESDGGTVNGYNTIHYSIDTARFEAIERKMLLSPGDAEKGDAWVTSEGCPVKLVLDSELHRRDGSLVEKLHYEESMVRK